VVFTVTTSSPEKKKNEGGEERRRSNGRGEALHVLDLDFGFYDFPIIPDLFPGKYQPIFPSGGLHPSHQPSPPYRLSLSLILLALSYNLYSIISIPLTILRLFLNERIEIEITYENLKFHYCAS